MNSQKRAEKLAKRRTGGPTTIGRGALGGAGRDIPGMRGDPDAFLRMNFLYQASHIVFGTGPPPPIPQQPPISQPCHPHLSLPMPSSSSSSASSASMISMDLERSIPQPSPPLSSDIPSPKEQHSPIEQSQSIQESVPVGSVGLSRFYNYITKKIAAKTVQRIHPEVKRTICKSCNTLLVPSLSSETHISGNKQGHVVLHCKTCGYIRRFITRIKKRPRKQRIREAQPKSEKEAQIEGQSEALQTTPTGRS